MAQPGYQSGSEPMWWWKVAMHLDEAQLALSNAMAHNLDDQRPVFALQDCLREGQAILLDIFRAKGLLPAQSNGAPKAGASHGSPPPPPEMMGPAVPVEVAEHARFGEPPPFAGGVPPGAPPPPPWIPQFPQGPGFPSMQQVAPPPPPPWIPQAPQGPAGPQAQPSEPPPVVEEARVPVVAEAVVVVEMAPSDPSAPLAPPPIDAPPTEVPEAKA